MPDRESRNIQINMKGGNNICAAMIGMISTIVMEHICMYVLVSVPDLILLAQSLLYYLLANGFSFSITKKRRKLKRIWKVTGRQLNRQTGSRAEDFVRSTGTSSNFQSLYKIQKCYIRLEKPKVKKMQCCSAYRGVEIESSMCS